MRPAAKAADRPGAMFPVPDIRIAVRNGKATMTGNENRISLFVDARTIIEKPITIRTAIKSGLHTTVRFLMTMYKRAAITNAKESIKPGDARMLLSRNCSRGV
jgi:hypothetical protein